jgi:hypothetical protein
MRAHRGRLVTDRVRSNPARQLSSDFLDLRIDSDARLSNNVDQYPKWKAATRKAPRDGSCQERDRMPERVGTRKEADVAVGELRQALRDVKQALTWCELYRVGDDDAEHAALVELKCWIRSHASEQRLPEV